MKPFPLICAAWLVASSPSWASDQEKRFLEFPNDHNTVTIDLSTVQLIQPGRFTVIEMTIDNPDVMKLELKALATLRTYCARADGQYPAPADLLTLGPPDMPIESISVKSPQSKLASGKTYTFKMVSWAYPYERLALGSAGQRPAFLHCKERDKMENETYLEALTSVMNGSRSKYLYDCKRGLEGIFWDEADDPTKPKLLYSVSKGTYSFGYYQAACLAVTHEAPYMPE
jgi:hypothetical protein